MKLTLEEKKFLNSALNSYYLSESYLLYESFDDNYLQEGLVGKIAQGIRIIRKTLGNFKKTAILYQRTKRILDRLQKNKRYLKHNKTYNDLVKKNSELDDMLSDYMLRMVKVAKKTRSMILKLLGMTLVPAGAAGYGVGKYIQKEKEAERKIKIIKQQSDKLAQKKDYKASIRKLLSALKIKLNSMVSASNFSPQIKKMLRSVAVQRGVAVLGFLAISAIVYSLITPITTRIMALFNKVLNMIKTAIKTGKKISVKSINMAKSITIKLTKNIRG